MFKRSIVYQLDAGAYKPTKAHPSDAGYDLYAREDVELSADRTFKIGTGVHVLIPEGFVGLVLPRSSFNCMGVATPTGVIDAGYTGSISVVLVSKFDLKVFAGNRIAQLVIVPLPDIRLVKGGLRMNKPLILEDWELVYLQGAVADSLKNFYPLHKEAEKSGVGLDAIGAVIKNYEGLQRKLEAAAGDKE